MEVFFNELSVKIASSDVEAEQWLTQLAELGQLLKKIFDSLSEDSFSFRRKEDFGEMKITNRQNIREFLIDTFDFSNPVYNFLYGIFDSPYISDDDPQRTEYELSTLMFRGQEYEESGLGAAYLKKSLTVSFLSEAYWDTCDVEVQIKKMNQQLEEIVEDKNIKNASKKKHLVSCHWDLLSSVFDWKNYKPKFDYRASSQNILHLIYIYSLELGEQTWTEFYNNLSQLPTNERITGYQLMAVDIAMIHKWELATGTLANNNGERLIYTIPNSDLIAALDTQHGEFEIHKKSKGNNHLGAISFDGKMKPPIPNRSLKL